jgi:hypothetical protein
VPPPFERDVHIALVELLSQALAPGWMYTHIPNGELRDKKTAAILKTMGVRPGWPDFIFVGRFCGAAYVFFLELKRKGEVRSTAQCLVGEHLMRSGCGYHWTDDLRDAVGTLRDLGIVRATVSA